MHFVVVYTNLLGCCGSREIEFMLFERSESDITSFSLVAILSVYILDQSSNRSPKKMSFNILE